MNYCDRCHSYSALLQHKSSHRQDMLGMSLWCGGWASTCQCREHGFNPWSGKNPHAKEPLGQRPTTTEPVHLEPMLCNERSRCSEKPAHHNQRKLACSIEDPAQPKINNAIFFLKKDLFAWRASIDLQEQETNGRIWVPIKLYLQKQIAAQICPTATVYFPVGTSSEEPTYQRRRRKDTGSLLGSGRSPGGRHGNPLQYSCLEKPQGQKSLASYSSWGHKELDTLRTQGIVYQLLPHLTAI